LNKESILFKAIPGVLLTLGIVLLSLFITGYVKLEVVLLSLVLGIIVGNLVKLPDLFSEGISFSSGKILEASIVLMAININYQDLMDLGWQTLVLIISSILVVLVLTYFLSKWLKCPGSTGWLVGFGTAICGSSAIAALAPSVSKNKEDIGISLAVVNALGLVGMIVLPFAAQQWLTNTETGMLLGASLHAMGNVAGAGFGLSNEVGEIAVTVKLGRIAMLTPALLLFRGILPTTGEGSSGFKLPVYLILFILISISVSFINLSPEVLKTAKTASKILLAMAMVAIGLKMSIKKLYSAGKRGLVFGVIVFVVQLAFLSLLLSIF
jgi:uncharacterized integral membrane protein (TIGR00698 family)